MFPDARPLWRSRGRPPTGSACSLEARVTIDRLASEGLSAESIQEALIRLHDLAVTVSTVRRWMRGER